MKGKLLSKTHLFTLVFWMVIPGVCLAVDADGDGSHSIASGGDDCDDNDPNRYPGNIEVCDNLDHDEDCDLETFGFRDADGDGFGDARCCNGSNCGDDCDDFLRGVNPNATEVCNGIDNDCDGAVDSSPQGNLFIMAYLDLDGDGFGDNSDAGTRLCPKDILENPLSGVKGDCDDQANTIHIGAPEACNGLDDNCNGVQDEGLVGACD